MLPATVPVVIARVTVVVVREVESWNCNSRSKSRRKRIAESWNCSDNHRDFHSARVPHPAMTHNKEGETRELKHAGSRADDDDETATLAQNVA